ncbi:MAG: DnaJ C-terminal domain-containing protein [Desulfopila sp.]
MEYKDYYKILGVEKDADQQAIKRAYRKLARKYHPDVNKNPEAEQQFKEIGEAYEVLKDTEKRTAYDQFGNDWQRGQDFKPPPGWEFRTGAGAAEGGQAAGANHDFSDFFEALFGQRGRQQASRDEYAFFGMGGEDRGRDIRATLTITLEESFAGAKKAISLTRAVEEDGQLRPRQSSLQVSIPKGILEGQQIRLEGQGDVAIRGGRRGDLFLEVVFAPHPLFTVKDRDVTMTLPVTPWEAALGAQLQVPTLGGTVTLKLPAGSQTGKRLRLKGKGLSTRDKSGDQYVVVAIHIPQPTDEKQRQLYEAMAESMAFNPRAKMGVES